MWSSPSSICCSEHVCKWQSSKAASVHWERLIAAAYAMSSLQAIFGFSNSTGRYCWTWTWPTVRPWTHWNELSRQHRRVCIAERKFAAARTDSGQHRFHCQWLVGGEEWRTALHSTSNLEHSCKWPSSTTAPVAAVVVALASTTTAHLLIGQNILTLACTIDYLTESRTLKEGNLQWSLPFPLLLNRSSSKKCHTTKMFYFPLTLVMSREQDKKQTKIIQNEFIIHLSSLKNEHLNMRQLSSGAPFLQFLPY